MSQSKKKPSPLRRSSRLLDKLDEEKNSTDGDPPQVEVKIKARKKGKRNGEKKKKQSENDDMDVDHVVEYSSAAMALNCIEKKIELFEYLTEHGLHQCDGGGSCTSGSRLSNEIRNIIQLAKSTGDLNELHNSSQRPILVAKRLKLNNGDLNDLLPSTSTSAQHTLKAGGSCHMNGSSDSENFSMEPTPQQKALSNALVVQKILSHFDAEELLDFRTVTKVWEKEATSHLLSPRLRETLQVRFSWCGITQSFQHICLGSLSEFNEECWKKCRRFPCSQFQFEGGDLNSPDTTQFLRENGESIKSLILNQSSVSSMQIYRNIFFKWTPQLKLLTLKSLPWTIEQSLLEPEPEAEAEPEPNREPQSSSSSSSTPPVQDQGEEKERNAKQILPSLEFFHLFHNCDDDNESQILMNEKGRIVHEILVSAPQLKVVTDVHKNFTENIVAAHKFHLIEKNLEWDFSPTNIGRFIRFANGNPGLHILSFKLDPFRFDMTEEVPDLVRSLNKLFLSSKDTLRHLTTYEELSFLPNLRLPVMTKMEELVIKDIYIRESSRILPNGQNIADIFPNLKTLMLKSIEVDGNETNPLFCRGNSSSTVTKLVMSNCSDLFRANWIQRAASFYPNVQVLIIKFRHDLTALPDVCKSIWTSGWNKLEEIRIHSDADLNSLESGLPGEMDAAITGINLEKCKQLRRSWKPGMQVEEITRTSPSVLDLPNLKEIHFSGWFYGAKNDQAFSHVSTLYAFQPLSHSKMFKATSNYSDVTNINSWTKLFNVGGRLSI